MAKAPKDNLYNIATISLDPKNFRHPAVKNGQEALKEMLSSDRHGVLELAQDIVQIGSLDPSVKLIITPDTKNKGQYLVLEGNRRVTALKTLHTPSLAAGLPEAPQYAKLSKEFLKSPITKVECVVLTPNDAKIWIKRKHYKGMGGAGSLVWDALATARSDASEGHYAKWLAAIEFLDANGLDTQEIMEKIEGKTTTIERVLGNAYVKQDLGVQISSNGTVAFENGDVVAGAKLLYKLLEDMSDPSFTEPQVTNATLAKTFLERYEPLSVKKGSPSLGKGKSAPAPTTPAKKTTVTKKGPVKRDRKYIADKGLLISHNELNNLYSELTKLPADKYPHTAAGMLRVFLEKATMVFIEDMKVKPPTGVKNWEDYSIKLKTKVAYVLAVIDPSKKNKKLNPARDIAAGRQDKLYTLDILNEYIHNHEALPIMSDLVKAWDKLHPYYEALFNHINASTSP